MSWIKKKWVSNLAVVLASVLVTLLVANGMAAWWVHNHRKDLSETSKAATAAYLSDDAVSFREQYNWQLHHLRGYKTFLNGLDIPSELLFSVINPYSENGPNILIQGDSWAEQANTPEARKILKAFADSHHVGLVSAGVGSYAPTPMAVQLRILRNDFGLRPTTLVAFIDQTDISDEFIRYTNPVTDENQYPLTVLKREEASRAQDQTLAARRVQIMQSDKPALVKIFTYKLLRKEEIRIESNDPARDEILEPMIKGASIKQKSLFVARLNAYISSFFANSAAKNIIFVTHPHRRHLLPDNNPDIYRGNVADLVNYTIRNSQWASRIKHIDVTASFKMLYANVDVDKGLFRENDDFSHLSDATYNNLFLPYLLNKIGENLAISTRRLKK